MFTTSDFINQAITAISAHAPEAFTGTQVAQLEALSSIINAALQERQIALDAQDQEIWDRFESQIAAEADAADALLSHSHGWR